MKFLTDVTSLFLVFSLTLAFDETVFSTKYLIQKSDVPKEVEKYAIGQALLEFGDSGNHELIAQRLMKDMNIGYGKYWVAIVGKTGFFPQFQAMINSTLWFLILPDGAPPVHVVLFKPLQEESSEVMKLPLH